MKKSSCGTKMSSNKMTSSKKESSKPMMGGKTMYNSKTTKKK